MYKQIRPFNQSTAGTLKNYCLRNVRLGYSIPAKYDTALIAWNYTQQHRDRNVPKGVAVPLFYNYTTTIGGVTRNYGHINVQLPNGTVWSDGEIFSSIADYEAKRAPDFIGWGESVNDVRVIEYAPDPVVSNMPPVGSGIQLIPYQTRNTFKAGTTTVAGSIKVTSDNFTYIVRGYDPKYPNRILINSLSGGGNGVALALYYTNGTRISGWKTI